MDPQAPCPSMADHHGVEDESQGHLGLPEYWDYLANAPNVTVVPYHLPAAANTHLQPAYNQNILESIPPAIYQGMGSSVGNHADAQLMVYIFRSPSGPQ